MTRTDFTARPASEWPVAELATLFNRGYTGYYAPVDLTEASFMRLVTSYDIDLSASRVVVGDQTLVAFAWLAIRGDRGWIGGMGVVPEARGYGLGRRVMEAVIDSAQERRLRCIDLEVLEQNLPASRIYEALGFQDVRWLDSWARRADAGPLPARPTDAAGARDGPRDLPAPTCVELRRSTCDELPWQRAITMLERASRAMALGIGPDEHPVVWVLYRTIERNAQILDVGSRRDATDRQREDIVRRLIELHPDSAMMLLNLARGDRMEAAFSATGFEIRWRQREMRLAFS